MTHLRRLAILLGALVALSVVLVVTVLVSPMLLALNLLHGLRSRP